MTQSLKLRMLAAIVPTIFVVGCDERATRIAREAADRQPIDADVSFNLLAGELITTSSAPND